METARVGQSIKHPLYGKGTVVKVMASLYTIHFPSRGNMDISQRAEGLELLDEEPEGETESGEILTMSVVERTLRRVLEDYSDIQQIVPLGERWQGGTMILQPADPSLKAKEIPIETFFHKIVMVRDRLRVMEQQINAHKVLTDAEKVDLQQYITRIYGSLTTFNVLFKNADEVFKGSGKEG